MVMPREFLFIFKNVLKAWHLVYGLMCGVHREDEEGDTPQNTYIVFVHVRIRSNFCIHQFQR